MDNMYTDIWMLSGYLVAMVVLPFIISGCLAALRKRAEMKEKHLPACHLSKQVLESRRRALDKEKKFESERLITNDKPPNSLFDGPEIKHLHNDG